MSSIDTGLRTTSKTYPHPNAERLRRIERLEYWLDRRFQLPFVRIPVGFDGILGLVPGVGDTVSAALSAYLIWEAHQAGADKATKARMLRNVGLDYLLGLVPVVGSIADFFYKANTRNLSILKEHLGREPHNPEQGSRSI